jgi:hypothetical protein
MINLTVIFDHEPANSSLVGVLKAGNSGRSGPAPPTKAAPKINVKQNRILCFIRMGHFRAVRAEKAKWKKPVSRPHPNLIVGV